MEKNILLEINRMNELMGIKHKPLIIEQGLFGPAVRMFIKKGLTFEQALDDAAELMVTSGRLTRQEADDAIKLIKNDRMLVNDINKTYVNSKLSSTLNDDIRISTMVDDLIKKSGNKSLDDFIKNIKLLTQKEVDFITSTVVKNMIKNNEFVNASDTFLNIWNPEIKKILRENFSNTKLKLNLSDFENAYEMASKVWSEGFVSRYKASLKNQLDSGKITKSEYDKLILNADKEVGEPVMLFLKDKHKYTSDSEIMSIIDEYRVAGRLDDGPGTISKPVYGKNNTPNAIAEFSDDGTGKSFFRGNDETPPINVVDNGVEIEFEMSPNVSNVTTTMEKKYPGFFARYLSNYTTDTLYNILRSYFGVRSSSAFYEKVEEINNTLVNDFLPKFTSQLDTINKDGIEGFAQLDSFTTTVRQLLLDLKLSKSNIETWDSLWGKIKIDIKQKASAAGLNDSVDSFITQIEKGGNSKNNIETFISTMRDASKNPKLFPVNGGRFALRSKEAIYDWLGISKFFKEGNESINKLKSTWKSNVIVDFLPQLLKETWNWFSGFLLYQAPRTIQRILKDINYGGITNGNIIKTAFSTYLAMMFTSFFFSPIYDSFRKYADTVLGAPINSLFEWLGVLDPNRKEEYDPTSGKSGFDVLVEGYKNKFKQIIDADLNLDDVVVVGKGPIIEATMALIEKYTKSPEEVEKEYLKSQNEILNEKISKRLQSNAKENESTWANADDDQRKMIKIKNGFNNIEKTLLNYTNPLFKANNPKFVPLSYGQYKKIKKSLVFIPGLDESTYSKLTQSTVEEKEKWIQTELEKTTKNLDLVNRLNDVMGYTAIKVRDGKHYKVIQRDNWLYYITPSIEDIKANPNVEQKQNDLNTILDKL